jgi:hypothetical protein
MNSYQLDQALNLRLGAPHPYRPLALAQPPGQHHEIEHQRRVREHELGEVDREVILSA